MKQLILSCTLWCTGSLLSHAQTIQVLTEQLAALKALQQTTQQGYRLVTGGLQTIGSIRDSEFGLHHSYIASLSTVNQQLAANPKLSALRQLQSTIVHQLDAALDYWRRQRALQP
jgi:hypothetical protein